MIRVAADTAPDARRRGGPADREGLLTWVFLLPSVVYLTALVVLPLALAVALALSGVTATAPAYRFTGAGEFASALGEGAFWRALGDTLLFTAVSTVLVVLCGQVLAHVLLARFRGRWLVRPLVLLPWTTPAALSATSWRWLLDSADSPAGWLTRALGVPDGAWHTRPAVAMGAVVAVHVWRLTPLAAVVMAAGLTAIPRDVRDAARVDGAGAARRALEVTLPLALPSIAVAALVTAVLTCADVTVVAVLTHGGPGGATQTLATLAYTRGAEGGALGQGAAIAVLLLPLPLAGATGLFRVVRRRAER
ncbi:sugar ABC transporter permease [Actinoallomurus purpureus]|uniref:carbohydrate ABC transporter permease n=1 Tax=Actinoallomurus purpureus TaxID=478114 RepID=UPI0020933B35|nr:sugar ABC transporter permease [Actinoallomurus purpureus]MCO6010610.1 sugar ABC transporter permease [Actinoallomurus purpureus]